MVFHTTDFDRVAFQVFQYTGHIGVDLVSKLLGTEERAAVLGRENRMNQQVRDGLAHPYITTQNGVLFIQKRPPFQGESGTAGLPRAKAPGLFCGPPSGGEKFRWGRYIDAYRSRRIGASRGLAANAFAPASRFPGGSRASDLLTSCKICEKVRLAAKVKSEWNPVFARISRKEMNEADFAMLQIKPLFQLSVWDKAPRIFCNEIRTVSHVLR